MKSGAYDEGHEAYLEGLPETRNPYDEARFEDFTAWNDGWMAAQLDAQLDDMNYDPDEFA